MCISSSQHAADKGGSGWISAMLLYDAELVSVVEVLPSAPTAGLLVGLTAWWLNGRMAGLLAGRMACRLVLLTTLRLRRMAWRLVAEVGPAAPRLSSSLVPSASLRALMISLLLALLTTSSGG